MNTAEDDVVRLLAQIGEEAYTLREDIDLGQDDPFTSYLRLIGDCFCPYIRPAARAAALTRTTYYLQGTTVEDLSAEIFYRGVVHAELLRYMRLRDGFRPKSLLQCENLIFRVPNSVEAKEGHLVFDWPYYMLHLIYTAVGIVFGRFCKGQRELSRSERLVPEPPEHFLVVRSVVKRKDYHLYKKQPYLLPSLLSWADDGRCVHSEFGVDQASSLSVDKMRNGRYYETVRAWAESIAPLALSDSTHLFKHAPPE